MEERTNIFGALAENVFEKLQYWYIDKNSNAPFRDPLDDADFNYQQLAYHNRYRARHGA